MKNNRYIIITTLVGILIYPSITLAAWWNPFSWFNKKPVIPVEEIKVEVSQKPTPVIKPVGKKDVILNSKPTVKKTSSSINSQTKEAGKENKPNPLSLVVPPTINEPKVTTTLSISNVNIDPKTTSVYVSWQTNMASESKLLLNGTAYQSKNGVDALHYVEIKDLTAGRSYTGSITALANNAWANQEIAFGTKEAPPKPVVMPIILPTISFGFTFPPQGNILVESNGEPLPEPATPKTAQLMWQNTATIGVRSVQLQTFKLRNVGSASNSAFANLCLYINDTQVSSVVTIDSMGYAVFDFTPITLNVGENTIKMVGDVVSGISRTITWSLRSTSDITLIDPETGQKVYPSGSGPFNFPFSAGTQTIKAAD